jgi:hypothetical protein
MARPKHPGDLRALNTLVPEKFHQALAARASREGCKKADVVRAAIARYLGLEQA